MEPSEVVRRFINDASDGEFDYHDNMTLNEAQRRSIKATCAMIVAMAAWLDMQIPAEQ